MNKQVVIAGLLAAIAANEEDPTPCEDFVTRATAEAKAAAEQSLEAWEDKVAEGDLQLAEGESQDVLEAAQDAYNDVTAAIVPFYNAEQDAYEDWQDAVNAKQAAADMLTAIQTNSAFTVSGEHMLLGEAADTAADAADDINDAQSAYNDKYAEINDATFTDAVLGAGEVGYRARLTAEYKSEALMLDAQDAADLAEQTAINNYTDQEAVVNALLVIEGCSLVTNADLTSAEELLITNDVSPPAVEDAQQLTKYQVCCTTRMATYLGTITQPAAGGVTEYPADCTTNAGWGMKLESDTYKASETNLENTYTGHCTSSQTAPAAESCDTETVYTDYRTAFLGAMKAARMQDVVDSACNNAPNDCSNGMLTNSAYWAAGTDSSQGTYHMLHPLSGTSTSATNPDLTWAYREGSTVNAAAAASNYSSESGLWDTMYSDLAKHLKDWTVAEARYWAYTASWEVHEALIQAAEDSEDALKTTREQKIDLSAAADAQVLAANKRVEMTLSDLNDEIAALALLQADLVAAEEAHAVQVWLAGEADAAALVQSTIVADWSEVCGTVGVTSTCSDALADLEWLHTTAAQNLADVQTALNCTAFDFATTSCGGFYRDRLIQAQAQFDMDDAALSNAEGKVLEFEGDVAAFALDLTAAIAECKGLGYDKAQLAKKALMDLEAANEEAAAEVALDYADKSAFAETGETNTLCAYPEKGADGSQEARPECSDGYCCGAAQKFLKDGTKLAIETCQKAEGVHTYDYYPPLPEGSPVEPTPETWRFQCISGAQKLAATAAAALAASYMMA